MRKVDRNKLDKAGFATLRGGGKGAYQNHVLRSNQVIVPYERLGSTDLSKFENGYVIRLYPEQYFGAPGLPKAEFASPESKVVVGANAFVLYRTHASLEQYPPLAGWQARGLEKGGKPAPKRGKLVTDFGHYVLRISAVGQRPARNEGSPQGLFAPEYANESTNFLCKCVLAWLVVHTLDSPYTTTQADHLRAILEAERLAADEVYESRGALKHGLSSCPLCLRIIRYQSLHEMVEFGEEVGLSNAPGQVAGATRSTVVNLFHLIPLSYDAVHHVPENVAWGHAVCNTRLGQRRCYSLDEVVEMGNKVGVIHTEGIETFGWISDDWQMIRSGGGAVWIQLNGDVGADEAALPAVEDVEVRE